ncbi:MAG: protein TolR [Rhodospirillaceae bacterium]|nr:protein TolR [Rhodospirillaceae bacterium]
MGAGLNGGGGPGSARGRRVYRPRAEINVTPFVDVMLVLLIVFMVTAPLLTVGVPVDLPQTNAPNVSEPEEPLVVTVTREGQVYVQETPVDLDNLVAMLVAITDANPEARIYVRGDRQLAYGRVLEVMGAINTAGFTRVALVAELPTEGPAAEPE